MIAANDFIISGSHCSLQMGPTDGLQRLHRHLMRPVVCPPSDEMLLQALRSRQRVAVALLRQVGQSDAVREAARHGYAWNWDDASAFAHFDGEFNLDRMYYALDRTMRG